MYIGPKVTSSSFAQIPKKAVKIFLLCMLYTVISSGSGSSVGIATDYGLDGLGSNPGGDEIFRPPDRPWGPSSLLYNGYWVFPGVKVRPGLAADH
jgi:hypothetical protein